MLGNRIRFSACFKGKPLARSALSKLKWSHHLHQHNTLTAIVNARKASSKMLSSVVTFSELTVRNDRYCLSSALRVGRVLEGVF